MTVFTSKQFREFLLHLAERGVSRVYVYRTPDGCGGHQHEVTLRPVHEPYTYCEFQGDMDDVYHHRAQKFVDHYEPFHERPYDVPCSLEELVFEFFTR